MLIHKKQNPLQVEGVPLVAFLERQTELIIDTRSTSQTSVDNNPINKENNPANVPFNINLVGLLISQLIFISNYTNIVL